MTLTDHEIVLRLNEEIKFIENELEKLESEGCEESDLEDPDYAYNTLLTLYSIRGDDLKCFQNIKNLTQEEINAIGDPKECKTCKSGDCNDCIIIEEHWKKHGVRIIKKEHLDSYDESFN